MQAGKSVLLIFNPDKTSTDNDRLPTHGAHTPPACIHFAIEIRAGEYPRWMELSAKNKITIEKEVNWNDRNKSLYFRDSVDNVIELITPGM